MLKSVAGIWDLLESRAFVLHCTAVFREKGVEVFDTSKGVLFNGPGGGDSVVLGLDGRRLTKPLKEGDGTAEGVVFADLDLVKAVMNRGFVDAMGHYSRPDLLWLGVDKREKPCVVTSD